MDNLYIKQTLKSPEVKFDKTGEMLIKGVSIHEDTTLFYKPLFDWIMRLEEHGVKVIKLELNFEYLSTSSTQMVIKLIKKIDNFKLIGVKVDIIWSYEEGDDSIKELGEDIANVIPCEFEFNEVNDSNNNLFKVFT